jgi:excisionase family DNA binding protein
MLKRNKEQEKILDVDAGMQGTFVFKDPVKLKINGSFEGKLDTKGSLIVGDKASIRADINGEEIIISGKVIGNITAKKSLKVLFAAHIIGDIITPVLSVEEGAVIHGKCQMLTTYTAEENVFNAQEVAKYLEVDVPNILDWASSGKIPAFKEGENWLFERAKIDEWVLKEKTK